MTIAGVTLTHPEKVLFPAQGVTKEALARYLAAVADAMLPFAANRLLSLVRCPEGAGDQCFFQRHLIPGFPASFRGVPVKEKDGGSKTYLAIDSVEALVGGAQMGVLEWHLWGSPADAIEHPDRLVMDLDPAPEVPFAEVKRAAADVRALLEAAGLAAWPMVTGGKGIHVVAPLDGSQDWEKVKGFASALARAMERQEPGRFIAKARKAARTGRIFVDWMRNERGATAICPYSPRAKPGATVAVPVTWAELARLDAADAFTIETAAARVQRQTRDPWAAARKVSQRIPGGATNALGG